MVADRGSIAMYPKLSFPDGVAPEQRALQLHDLDHRIFHKASEVTQKTIKLLESFINRDLREFFLKPCGSYLSTHPDPSSQIQPHAGLLIELLLRLRRRVIALDR